MKRAVVLICSLSLFGCPGFGTKTMDNFGPDGDVTFENSVKALLAERCVSCHSDPPVAGAPNALVTYDQAYAARIRIVERSVRELTMPPGAPLSAEEQATLLKWVETGAERGDVPSADAGLDGDAGIADAGEVAPLTWANGVTQLMEARCSFAGCHGGNIPSAQLDLTTYEGYLAGGVSGDITGGGDPAESILIDHFRGRRGRRVMPLGGQALNEAQIRAFENWIEDGSPQ
ncbi:MAG: c-type cytochrome domain-containing protein [Bradymonadia bacterium]